MHAIPRRRLLTTSGLALAATPLAALAGPPAHAARGLPVRGADLSFTLQLEAAGVTWRDGRRTAKPERILAERGANWVRLRIWNDPPAGYSDAESALRLARRAKRAGMKVLIDFHYSDFWADPGKQNPPAGWPVDDPAALAATLRDYTRSTLEYLGDGGGSADMVQVGNEIIGGFLWPAGQVFRPDGEHWPEFTTLLKAGIAGAREGAPGARIMLHIDRGGDNGGSRYFFDHALEQGVRFDVIGQSYYPFWHGSLAALRANLNDLSTRYRKDLVVVETSYPWTMGNGDELENLITDPALLPDGDRFPPTPAGQAAYYEALRTTIAGVPGGRGLGFMAWEPEWIPGVGWEPGDGNPNDNLTLFDWTGQALPALQAFHP